MKASPHTALPWRHVQVGKPHFIYADRDVLVAMVMRQFVRGVDKANAGLIVRAVNCHQQLVRLVQDAARLLAGYCDAQAIAPPSIPVSAAQEFCRQAAEIINQAEPGIGPALADEGPGVINPHRKENESCPTGAITSWPCTVPKTR